MARHFPRSEREKIIDELHKPVRRNFPRRRVELRGISDLIQSDLIEMRKYKSENEGYNYILVAINAFSKKAWALPLKTKTGAEVAKCTEKILKSLKIPPKLIQTDFGKEYFNSDFKKVMEKFKIKHYRTYSDLKASIVERFNRTLKNLLYKQFTIQGNHKWLEILGRLIKKYNKTVHSTIGMAPDSVNKNNEKLILQKYLDRKSPKKVKIKYKIGDPVRLSKYKHLFEKSYTPNYSTEVFFIDKIQNTIPVTYKLKDLKGEDIAGGWYSHELLKTKYKDIYLVEHVLEEKGNRVKVKWLGFDNSHNQWVNKSDIL